MGEGPTPRERILAGQAGWSQERAEAGYRAAVYAVATSEQLGVEDLVSVRIAAETGQNEDEVVRLAQWFDSVTYPLNTATHTVDEALAELPTQGFSAHVIAAFRAVQPLIQPVGL